MTTRVNGTIKPLVWEDYDNPAFSGPDVAIADVPFNHRYQVQRDPWAATFMAFLHPRLPITSSTPWWESKGHKTIEAAKSAAQADYEARILAQIEQDPEVQPVAWRYRSIDKPAVWSHLTDHRRTVYGRIGMEEQPLYAQPSPCASKPAESDPQPALSDTDAPKEECTICGRKGCSAETCFDAPSSEAGELLPCPNPFCKRDRRIKITWDLYKRHVHCTSCGVRGPAGECDSEAIIAWNRRTLPAARAEVSAAEAVTIPEDVAELVLRIGRAEWGATAAKSAEEHATDLINSISITDEHFKTEGPHRMDGLYIEGTETVICHSGTSPNSPGIAQALTGAWNRLHDEAAALRALTEAGQ